MSKSAIATLVGIVAHTARAQRGERRDVGGAERLVRVRRRWGRPVATGPRSHRTAGRPATMLAIIALDTMPHSIYKKVSHFYVTDARRIAA